MNKTNSTLVAESRQDLHETIRTPEDRRLLLGAYLRLLCHRHICGKPILQNDVIRMVSLTNDVEKPDEQHDRRADAQSSHVNAVTGDSPLYLSSFSFFF